MPHTQPAVHGRSAGIRALTCCVSIGLMLSLAAGGCHPSASSTLSYPQSAPETVKAGGYVSVVDGKDVPPPNIPMGDPETIRRILEEGQHNNHVMDNMTYLTQKIGPRLTGSANAEAANRWTLERFKSWGLNADLYKWGEVKVRFDRGPSYGKTFTAHEKKNEDGTTETEWVAGRDFELTTLAWSRGTDGPVKGPVVRVPETEEEYAKVKDKLKGAWVLLKPMDVRGRTGVRGPGGAVGERMKHRQEARAKVGSGTSVTEIPLEDRVIFDGILGFISTPKDVKDRIWTTAYPQWREKNLEDFAPDTEAIVRLSDYDYINSRLTDGDQFVVELDLENKFTKGPFPTYDTIAEIPGTTWPDQVVVVCGHLDSWNGPGSQGATDNGTGSMVALEAARILSAAHVKPKRTIRFCLWTGEEQGLLGSKEYVKSLGDKVQKISAVFNDDGGTNYEGGLKATKDMVQTLAAATAPVNYLFVDSADGKPMTVNVQTVEKFPRAGSSDQYSFVEVGVPGFFWDEVGRADYSWGWHTQHDRLDLAIPEYLAQSATCAAVTAYNMACTPELLPRVPQPPKGEDGPERPRRPRN